MLRTEDEAKKCWCPFARVAFMAEEQFAANRSDITAAPGFTPCIGSACMAWRWKDMKLGHSLDYHKQASSYSGQRGSAEERHAAYLRENPLCGFCGLAGQP